MRKGIVSRIFISLLALVIPVVLFGTDIIHAFDFTEPVKLTVELPKDVDDLKPEDVQVDLYKIAGIEQITGYEAYTYKVADKYKAILKDYDLEHTDGDDEDITYLGEMTTTGTWPTVAKLLADAVLKGDVKDTPTPMLVSQKEVSLDPGLYLLIPHGKDLTALKDYAEKAGDDYVSLAYSDEYKYSFTPQLISLPSTVEQITGEEEKISTDTGEWSDTMTVVLKPGKEPRYTDITITKDLTIYENKTPVTFVFRVEGTMGEGEESTTVYSNVASLTFSAAGVQSAKLERIPVGAQITVTEIYAGAGYELVGEGSKTITVQVKDPQSTTDPNTVSFTNKYSDDNRTGYGVRNTFENQGEKGWFWKGNDLGGDDEK